jgi:TniQ
MPDAKVYDAWEPSRPAITQRSYFYPLAPIGVGTAAVESLTGYISRLAAAHVVETGTLVNRELLPRVPYTKGVWTGQAPPHLPGYSFYIGAHTLNGVGHRTQLWVTLLEQLTCVPRLGLLTTLPWAGAIACVRLLRPHRTWCPSCYGDEGPSAQSAHERLLWVFQVVTVCLAHRQPLESVCPFCGRTQYVLSPRSRPGYCSRCYRWLGRTSDGTMVHSDLTEQIRVAEMVGALLAASPTLPAHFGLDLFRKNVRGLVQDAGGYRRFHAGIQHPYVRDWVRRPILPRMNSLVKLSYRQQVPLIRLLTERMEAGNKRDQKCASKAHYRVEAGVVEAALAAALRATLAPPLEKIANQLGYRTVTSLRFRYPTLCSEIVQRRQTWTGVSRPSPSKIPVPRERIEAALTAELAKPGFTDLRAVAASVGLSSKRRFYKDFHDLRRVISAKNAAIKKRRRETIMATLVAAFNEQPLPTVADVARRLGYATVKPLTSRFRELSLKLRASRRRIIQGKSRHRVSERVRETLSHALGEFPPPSCTEVVRRFAGHPTQIREGFPDLWRALRERYVQHKREVHRTKREAFTHEVYRVAMELHSQGVFPTARLVLAAIPQPQFRSLNIVAETVRLARHELTM